MVGNLDNAGLQALLASLQAPQAGSTAPAQAAVAQHGYQGHHLPAATNAAAQPQPHIDMNALLGNLRNVASAGQQHSYQAPAVAYGAAVQGGGYGGGAGGGYSDSAAQVQSIMEQLKRAAH